MRPPKVTETEILNGLSQIFRSKGFEGASLNDLAKSTGLKKASLYHRYPNGKQEMAEAVLNHIDEWVEKNVFHALTNEEIPVKKRIKKSTSQIRILYSGGNDVCIFRALSMKTGLELFSQQINDGMNNWISAFNKLGMALGLPSSKVKKHAIQTLIDIQGALIVSRGLNDVKHFENSLKLIEKRYSQE